MQQQHAQRQEPMPATAAASNLQPGRYELSEAKNGHQRATRW
jgi:hypothetical protein